MSAVVVASAYDTKGTGRHLECVTSNGWLIAVAANLTTSIVYIYKSADNGITWSQLCSITGVINGYNPAIAAYGNKVTVIWGDTTTFYSNTFDVTTVTNVDQNSSKVTACVQTYAYEASLSVKSTGIMCVAARSRNSSYPGNSNIIYFESTTSAVTAWSPFMQVTTTVAGSPAVIIKSNDYPKVDYVSVSGSSYQVNSSYYNGSAWVATTTPQSISGTDVRDFVSNIIKKNGANVGRIFTAWEGKDNAEPAALNINVAYSDDGGVNHTIIGKITSGNTINRKSVVLSEDSSGNIFAIYDDNGSIVYQKCTNGTTTFGGLTTLDAVGTNPSSIERLNFSTPFIIYMSGSNVKSIGVLANVAPNAPTPTAPTNGGFYNTVSSMPFSWNFSDPDVGDTQSAFYIETSTTSNFAAMEYNTGWVASSAQSYNWAGTWAQGVHYWRMYTKDAAGAQSPVSAVWSFTMDSVAPNAPTLTIGAITGNTVALSWTAPVDSAPSSGIANTYVYMRTWNGTTWVDIAGSPVVLAGAQTSYTYTGLVPNTLYHVIIQYRDNANNYGAYPEIPFITNIQQLFFSNPF
jgi:hypothetical protein